MVFFLERLPYFLIPCPTLITLCRCLFRVSVWPCRCLDLNKEVCLRTEGFRVRSFPQVWARHSVTNALCQGMRTISAAGQGLSADLCFAFHARPLTRHSECAHYCGDLLRCSICWFRGCDLECDVCLIRQYLYLQGNKTSVKDVYSQGPDLIRLSRTDAGSSSGVAPNINYCSWILLRSCTGQTFRRQQMSLNSASQPAAPLDC